MSTKDQDQVGCRMYILGVADGVDLESRLASRMHFCVPPGIPTLQLEQVITMSINEDVVAHPQDNKMPAVSFIGAVFARLFPCREPVPVPGSRDPVLKNYPNSGDAPAAAAETVPQAAAGMGMDPKSLTEGYELIQPPIVPKRPSSDTTAQPATTGTDAQPIPDATAQPMPDATAQPVPDKIIQPFDNKR